MLAAILAVLQSLPEILSMIRDLISWINKISGNDPAGFIKKSASAFNQLANANSQDEHAAAAKALADLVAGMQSK